MKKVKACPLASPDTPRSPSHAAQPNIWRFQKARTLFSKKGPGEVRRNSGMRICRVSMSVAVCRVADRVGADHSAATARSEEHTSELQSLMRISYAVFCLKKKNDKQEET